VADGDVPGQRREILRADGLGNQPQPLLGTDPGAVGGDDAGRLLAPVLERVEGVVGLLGGIGNTPEPDQSTVVFYVANRESPEFPVPGWRVVSSGP